MLSKVEIEKLADAVASRILERLASSAERKFVSVKEFACRTSISERTVARAIADGRLDSSKVGSRVLIPADAVIKQERSGSEVS